MSFKMLTIPSIPSRVSEVENFLQKVAKNIEINQERYPDMLISLTEAVNNAIVHGNKEDHTKLVRIEMIKNHKTITFTVSDEGRGFNMDCVPNPTAPENLECCGGRGVYIMSQLCDRLNFQNNGSTVEMHFKVK